jgi:hypothetical protein
VSHLGRSDPLEGSNLTQDAARLTRDPLPGR